MLIRFDKLDHVRGRLTISRTGSELYVYDLPPHAAYHDLAHYVVEKALGIQEGFWGIIAAGHKIEDYYLPDEQRPFQITPEGYRAEYIATLVQSGVATGRISPEYIDMIRNAALDAGLPFPDLPPNAIMDAMLGDLSALSARWTSLAAGEGMELEF